MDIVYGFQMALKIFLMVYWIQFGQIENSEGACEFLTEFLSIRQLDEIFIPSSWPLKIP